jgi:methionyl-tRNA synthetase
MTALKEQITIEDLNKVDVRVGTILSAERVEGSTKLIKLEVDFGSLGKRIILTGMQEYYAPEDFTGIQTTFIVNLPPRKMMGMESEGMIFAVDNSEGKPIFLIPNASVVNGDTVI